MPMPIMFLIILVLLAVVVARNVVIVPQAAEYVVERLGSYSATWENGLQFELPFIERVAKRVSLKEAARSISSPRLSLPVVNATMQIRHSRVLPRRPNSLLESSIPMA